MNDRFRACLLGGAIGDALGAPVEFLTLAEIRRKFGPRGIRDFAPAFGRPGTVTDDTQMTLFVADGLLRREVVRAKGGRMIDADHALACAHLRWLGTQEELPPDERLRAGWLDGFRELRARRAPGHTCIRSLLDLFREGRRTAANNSKGCGGVMRVAPVGLHEWALRGPTSGRDAFDLAVDIAAITHDHPTGRLAAGAFAAIIHSQTSGAPLRDCLAAAQRTLAHYADHDETSNALSRAQRVADSGMPADAAIRELGEGWVAEEALAIALYCALVAPSFEEGVILAVNHDGDSDSTGAIAGNILGLMHGLEGIPTRWIEGVELKEAIVRIADDLAAGGVPSREMRERYP